MLESILYLMTFKYKPIIYIYISLYINEIISRLHRRVLHHMLAVLCLLISAVTC